MDQKLVEMMLGLLAGQGKDQVVKEIVELLDPRTKKKVYDCLKVKTLASLKSQRTTVDDAIKRYGTD